MAIDGKTERNSGKITYSKNLEWDRALDGVDDFEIIAEYGDLIAMIESRQNTFLRSKTLIVSTPKANGPSFIADKYEQLAGRKPSYRFHYYVPCQHCGEYRCDGCSGTNVTARAHKAWAPLGR